MLNSSSFLILISIVIFVSGSQSFAESSDDRHVASMNWTQSTYLKNEMGVLQIVEPDMNKNPRIAERLEIHIQSTSDPEGINITATETGVSTGIFESQIYFVTNHDSRIKLDVFFLFAPPEDIVVATYIDKTLPVREDSQISEFVISKKIRIIDPIPPGYYDGCSYRFLGSSSYEVYRHSIFGEPRIVDAFGNTLSSVNRGQQIQIKTDLANSHDGELPFAYIVQVKDENDVVVQLVWITGGLSPGQSFSPALSWTPDAPGSYVATVFLWEAMEDRPISLCDPNP